MTGFTARYAGICEDCSNDIEPGDLIVTVGDHAYVHAWCSATPRPTPACPTCHLALPVSGICDECDG